MKDFPNIFLRLQSKPEKRKGKRAETSQTKANKKNKKSNYAEIWVYQDNLLENTDMVGFIKLKTTLPAAFQRRVERTKNHFQF